MGEKEDRRLASDALRKQLARDVEALAGIGITVEVEGEREGRLYRLPASGYSPAKVDLGEEERSVLLGALRALRRDFPYSLPLRLGIANLIGTVSLDDDEAGPARAVVSTSQDEAVARRVASLERAIARRKLVRFDYYTISRDESSEREIEPYALSLLEGIWYVTGWDTEREAVRQFRLSRMGGRVTFATKKESGDFEVPDNFERRIAGPRAPWQLQEPDKVALIRVSPEAFHAARRKYLWATSLGGREEDGSLILWTRYLAGGVAGGTVGEVGRDRLGSDGDPDGRRRLQCMPRAGLATSKTYVASSDAGADEGLETL